MEKTSVMTGFLGLLAALALASLVGCGSGGGGGGNVVTSQAPTAPSGILAMMVTENSARLSWTDNSDNEDGFEVGTCTTTAIDAAGTYCADGWVSVVRTPVNFHDFSSLTAETDYAFYVRAYNSAGASKAYRVVFKTLSNGGGGEPLPPSSIQESQVTATSARVSWTDNSSDEDGFQIGTCNGVEATDEGGIYCSSDWVYLDQTIVNFYDFTNLTPGTDYTYYIRSYNSSGASNAYRVHFTTEPLAIPEAPSDIAASIVTDNSARLSWTDNSDNEDGFKLGTCSGSVESDAGGTYCVDGWTLVADGIVSPYDLSGLTSGTDYAYYIRAYNTDGESNAYQVSFTTLSGGGGVVPAAPSTLEATQVTVNSARLSWTDNSDNEDGFQIGTCSGAEAVDAGGTYCDDSWTFVAETTDVIYDLEGLTPGTDYSYYIRAYNLDGASNAYRVDFKTSSEAFFYAERDYSVNSASPTTTYNLGNLGVGCYWPEPGLDGACTASLIYFDLSSLAANEIESATFKIIVWYLGIDPTGPLADSLFPRDWLVTPVGETPWAEVTWDIAYGGSLEYRSDYSVANPPPTFNGQSFSVDVTSVVGNWNAGIWTNNGLLLESSDITPPDSLPIGGSDDAWSFFSSDTSPIVEPRLEIVYR